MDRRKLKGVILGSLCLAVWLAIIAVREVGTGDVITATLHPDEFVSIEVYDVNAQIDDINRKTADDGPLPRLVLSKAVTRRVLTDIEYHHGFPIVKITFPGIATLASGEACRIGISRYGNDYTILTIRGQDGYYLCQEKGGKELTSLVEQAIKNIFIPTREGSRSKDGA